MFAPRQRMDSLPDRLVPGTDSRSQLTVRVREKQQLERASRKSGYKTARYEIQVGDEVKTGILRSQAVLEIVSYLAKQGLSPARITCFDACVFPWPHH